MQSAYTLPLRSPIALHIPVTVRRIFSVGNTFRLPAAQKRLSDQRHPFGGLSFSIRTVILNLCRMVLINAAPLSSVLFSGILSPFFALAKSNFPKAAVCPAFFPSARLLQPTQAEVRSADTGLPSHGISFPANRLKNWLFPGFWAGKLSAWRLNSALTSVKQRRRDVRKNFPYANAKKQHNFFTGLREKNPSKPCGVPQSERWLSLLTGLPEEARGKEVG